MNKSNCKILTCEFIKREKNIGLKQTDTKT